MFNASTNTIPSYPVAAINLLCILLNGFIWTRVGKKIFPSRSETALKLYDESENKILGKGRLN